MTNLVGREPGTRGGDLPAEILVHPERLRRLDRVGEQVAQDLHVHRGPGADRGAKGMTVLGREGRVGDQPFVFRFLLQGGEEKFRSAFQRRVNAVKTPWSPLNA